MAADVGESTGKGSGDGDPYELLGVSPDASFQTIRKKYFLLARRVHPDRNKRKGAVEAFQALQKAYGILSDPEKRRLFDRTGCTDQDSDAFWNAYQNYREIYPEITALDVEKFARRYRGSEEEEIDLRKYYLDFAGDVSRIFSYIVLSRAEDGQRFATFFDSEIKKGKLLHEPAYGRTREGLVNGSGALESGDDSEGENLEDTEAQDEMKLLGDAAAEKGDENMASFIVDDDSDEITKDVLVSNAKRKRKPVSEGKSKAAKSKGKSKSKAKSKSNSRKKSKQLGRARDPGDMSMDDLANLIRKRGSERMSSLISNMEERYSKKRR